MSITFDRRGSSISPIGGTIISSSANASVVLLSFTVSVYKNSFSFGVKAERSLEGENFRKSLYFFADGASSVSS